ncbi:tetratricopeptide repeat protein [Desulfococcaceae bacterium HSG8]|nr:tetratricopeptide repeat protein [Desulfococcaceae bacterium HSG8]
MQSKRHFITICAICSFLLCAFFMPEVYSQAASEARSEEEYEQELVLLEQALKECRDEACKKETLLKKADTHFSYGKLLKKKRKFEAALAQFQKAQDVHRPEREAFRLAWMADIYQEQFRFPDAIKAYRESLAILKKLHGPEYPAVATELNNLAGVYDSLGEYENAKAMLDKALAIHKKAFGNDHPKVAIRLNNLGEVYRKLGEYEKAIGMFEQALDIDKKAFGNDHPNVAIRLNNLGSVYKALGEYEKAIGMFEQALDIDKKAFGNDHLDVATDLNNLGSVYYSLGEYEKAIGMFEKALILAEKSRRPELLSTVQGNLSDLLAKTKKPGAAIFFGKQAVNTIQTMRSKIKGLEKSLQTSFLKKNEEYYKHLADLLINQGRLPEARQVLAMLKQEEYFDFIRRDATRSGTRSETADYTDFEKPWLKDYQEIQSRLVKIGEEAEKLKRKKRTPEQDARLEQLKKDLMVANKAFTQFLDELYAGFEQISDEKRKIEIAEKNLKLLKPLQATLKHLGGDSVLLHYIVTESKLRIILTTPHVQLSRDSLISAKDLNRKITEFRESLENRHADPLPGARELYNHILEPVADDLKQAGAKTLMISLDGMLRYLPVAALHDGTGYAAEQYRIIIYTEAAKPNLTIPVLPKWEMAAMGLTRKLEGFSALPAVKQELEGIVIRTGSQDTDGVIPGVIHLDQAFTKKALNDMLDIAYPVLHLASHFVFRPGTDRDTFLLLGDGSRLSLADIHDENFEFTDLDLLTLSACDTATGGGRNANGREVEGLGVLAQKRGAKAVLATLWSVADRSTGIFMQNMYKSLREKNLGKAEVLQHAQLMFIRGEITGSENRGDGERNRPVKGLPGMAEKQDSKPAAPYSHPYYWAPFILMGNWL